MANSTEDIVLIRWFDASYQRGECELDDLVTRVELEDVGFLVREDNESISVALSRYANDETWRYIEHIPKVNVISITRLIPVNSEFFQQKEPVTDA